MIKHVLLLVALLGSALPSFAQGYIYQRQTPSLPKIAIIIDDIGYNLPQGERATELKGAVTLAVLPKTPGSKMLAQKGFKNGKEIMLHAPMSNTNHFDLGPGALTEQLSKKAFIQTLNSNIASIPHVQGVNNHMGSFLTTQKKQMAWVMQELAKKQLYFIDSFTHPHSLAFHMAKRFNLAAGKRDVFLDNDANEKAIEQAFQLLIKRAHQQGFAIAIGHPYPETMNVLERELAKLKQYNVQLLPVSKLINANPALSQVSKP